jgi:multisubunit Na+/H+ antiporter MnhG subunit
MAEQKGVSYVLGIVSLAIAFIAPLGGLVIGIIGLVYNRKEKSKVAKTLNILGIVFAVLVWIWSTYAVLMSQNFPVY